MPAGCSQVWPSGGELAARSEVKVTVEFAAVVKKELSEVITLEVRQGSCHGLALGPGTEVHNTHESRL
jgi:hypothetical protein